MIENKPFFGMGIGPDQQIALRRKACLSLFGPPRPDEKGMGLHFSTGLGCFLARAMILDD